jgi:asparagine synthase (glutamine-hydrolysing)
MEVRLPLLDYRVVEWAYSLPASYLIRDGWLKWVLRKAVEPGLPPEVTWRKVKMGFPFPLAEWLREAKPRLSTLAKGEATPCVDRAKLFQVYDALAASHPAYLWRCLSAVMWWDRCVLGIPGLEEPPGSE